MLSRREITDQIIDILKSANDNGKILENYEESSKIMTDFGLSSVGMLYMAIALEESFNIEFDDVNIADFVTLKDVIDYIEAKIS